MDAGANLDSSIPAGEDDAAPRDAATTDAAYPDAGVPVPQRLLYVADQETDEVRELYVASVDPDGTISVDKVNGDTDGRSVSQIVWTPDGNRVAWVVGNSNGILPDELYVAFLDGATASDPVLIDSDLEGLGSPAWSPDGLHLGYAAHDPDNDDLVLRVAAISGPAPFATDVVVTFGESANTRFSWSPDSRWIAYQSFVDGRRQVLGVDVTEDDPQPVTLSATASDFANTVNEVFEWSAAEPRLFYLSDQDTDGVIELHVVDLSGVTPSAPVRLNTPLASGSTVTAAYWSPDGARLAYLTDSDANSSIELHVVDLDGDAVNISDDFYDEPYVVEERPVWSPDSTRLVYLARPYGTSFDIFAVDVAADPIGAPARLNPPLSAPKTVSSGSIDCVAVAWSHDSKLVTFAADKDITYQVELWTTSWTGAAPATAVQSNATFPHDAAKATDCGFAWSPVRRTLLYRAEQDELAVHELFAVASADLGSPTQVNAAFALEGDVLHDDARKRNFVWSPDGNWIAYLADQDINERVELYLVAHDALGSSSRVNPDLVGLGDVRQFWWLAP